MLNRLRKRRWQRGIRSQGGFTLVEMSGTVAWAKREDR